MILTIGGPPGSGKTTVAKELAGDCGFLLITSGNIFREMAEKRGMSLEEFGRFSEGEHGIDTELDRLVIEKVRGECEERDIVVDGRLAAHMLERNGLAAFKVWIDAPLEVRVERISGREGKERDEVEGEILERERSEKTRYDGIYGIDLADLAIYDLVIDSSEITPGQVVMIIREKVGI